MPFLDEIQARLVAQGMDDALIFQTSRAFIPAGEGPYLSLTETGGSGGSRTHNDTGTEQPTAQLAARAKTSQAARTLLKQAYDALGGVNGLSNITLSGTFYLQVLPRQNITDAGEDESGRPMLTFNIEVEKQPS